MMRLAIILLGLVASASAAPTTKYQTVQQLELTATTTSALALDRNNSRTYLLVINKGSVPIFVKAGSAHSGTEGVKIISGGNWEPYSCPVDSLYVVSESGSQSYSIIEGN